MKLEKTVITMKEIKEKPEKIIFTNQFNVKESSELLIFLLAKLTSLSRNNVKRLLANRQVLVNGVVIKQFNYLLAKEDLVQITKYPFNTQNNSKKRAKNELDIIFEDDDFIAINKPAGLLSIASDNEKIQTAYRLLTDYVMAKNKTNRVYAVHRIDKETSGVFLVVKKEKVRNILQNHWNDFVLKREYIAIIEGTLQKKEDTIKSYLKKSSTNLMYSSKTDKSGQFSITHYKVLKENKKYSLLNVNIDTGRKNQIRVHLKDIGHTIIGDDKYGSSVNPLKRLGLHASVLEFTHPLTQKKYVLKAKTPVEFGKLF